jgi:predicted HicB family RNase H-like nuclease
MPAPLHQRAKDAAWRRRTSLNKLMIEALTEYLRAPSLKKGGR